MYETIADDLRRRIHSGRIKTGEPVGSLPVLQRRYGAAQNTVRAALRILADEGLVFTVPGKGTFATEKIQAGEASDSERIASLEKRMADLECQMMDTRAGAGLDQWQPGQQEQAQ